MTADWFYWYVSQATKQKTRPVFNKRYLCPCCYMPTLSAPAAYDICCLCFWEDDGQDSDDADVFRGGPNGSYTLSEARDNFTRYCTMYRPEDSDAFAQQQQHLAARKALYLLFLTAVSSGEKADWRNVVNAEKRYYKSRRHN